MSQEMISQKINREEYFEYQAKMHEKWEYESQKINAKISLEMKSRGFNDDEYDKYLQEIFEVRRQEYLRVIAEQKRRGVTNPKDDSFFYRDDDVDEITVQVFIDFLKDDTFKDGVLRHGMASVLSSPVAYKYFDTILDMYQKEEDAQVKFALIQCVSAHIKRHKEHSSLIEKLLLDEKNGNSREYLLSEFYKKSKDPKDHELIRNLFFHPDFRLSLDNEIWMSTYWKKTDPALYALWKESNKLLRYKKYPNFFP